MIATIAAITEASVGASGNTFDSAVQAYIGEQLLQVHQLSSTILQQLADL